MILKEMEGRLEYERAESNDIVIGFGNNRDGYS